MAQQLFTVSVVSLPLNFTILLHPDSIASLGIEENGYALVKGVNGLITVVKVVQDQDCPATGTRITHSVQMTLGASPGDSVPILPFSEREHCEAIQIAPLFDKNSISDEGSDFTSAVKNYFASDPRPISVDSIFTLIIDSEERAFKILKCSPTDRSFSSKSTKLYFTAEPGPLLPKPLISKHLNTLVLDKQIIDFVKNNIYFPVNRQNVLRSINLPTSTGIIIEGPPGCGKTSLLSAISNTVNIPSIYCAARRLKKLSVSDYIEKLNQVFGYTAEKPQCLIMFDDIDYIVSSFRQSKLTADRVKLATFFNLFDAVMNRSGVIVIATAVSPSTSIDPALLRDGRFGQRIVLNQPTLDQRKELIRLYTGGMRIEDEDLNEIVRKIGGKSNAEGNAPSNVSAKEIERICRVAVTTLIEEATGNQGTEVVDSLAVYTLNTRMKAMHFGVTSTIRNRNRRGDDEDEDDDGGRRRRRRRRRHNEDDESNQEEDEDDDDGHRRHRRHRRRRHRFDDDDDEENNQEEDDDEGDGGSRRRRRRRHRDEMSSSSRRRRSHRSSRRRRNEDDEEEDEGNNRNEEEDDDFGGGRNRNRNQNRNRRNNRFNDDEDDEDNDPFSKQGRNVGRRGRNNEDSDEDDQGAIDRNKRFPSRNSKKPVRNDDGDDDEDEDDPFNKRAKRRPPPSRGRNMNEDDDEDDDNEMGSRKRGSRSMRRNGGRDDEVEDDNSSRRRSRRRRNNNEDDEEENERRPRARRSRNVYEDDDED